MRPVLDRAKRHFHPVFGEIEAVSSCFKSQDRVAVEVYDHYGIQLMTVDDHSQDRVAVEVTYGQTLGIIPIGYSLVRILRMPLTLLPPRLLRVVLTVRIYHQDNRQGWACWEAWLPRSVELERLSIRLLHQSP